jgi:hypothetical protein
MKQIRLASLGLMAMVLMGAALADTVGGGVSGKDATAAEVSVWAIGEGVRINPLTGKAFEENPKMLPGGVSGDYRARNWVWDGATKTVALKGAANEVVSFQLIIEGTGVKGVNATASDLASDGRTIPAKQYSFLRAFYIKVKQVVDGKRAPYPLEEGWYPDPLVPFETPGLGAPFAMDGGNFGGEKPAVSEIRNQTVWVDLWIPPKTPRGLYTGTVTVASEAGQKTVAVKLQVFGFEMTAKANTVLEFMSYAPFAKMSQAQRDACFTLANEHRATITTIRPYINFDPPLRVTKGGKTLEWAGFDEAYGPAISGSLYKQGPRAGVPIDLFVLPFDAKLDRPDAKGPGRGGNWPIAAPTKNNNWEVDFTPDYVAQFKALLKDASEHFAQKYPGTTLAVFQDSLDEPGFHKAAPEVAMGQLRSLQGYTKIVRELNLKNVIYKFDIGSGFDKNRLDLDGNGKEEGAKDVVSALPGVDLWNVNGMCIDLDVLQPAIKRGAKVWFYNGFEPRVGPTVIATEAVGPRSWPWVVFTSHMHGSCKWYFLEGAKSTDKPWTTGGSLANPGDALFMYPGDEHGMPDVIFPSIRLKAYRRGMQDYEYLHAVAVKDGNDKRAMAFSVRGASRPMTGALDMKDFQDDASNERATVKVVGGDQRCWPHHPEAFENVRYEMGEYLGGAAAR